MLMDLWRNSAPLALLGLVVSVATVGMAIAYASRPSEQRLALMRPLSLAAVFGGLTAFTVGLATVLRGIAVTGSFSVTAWNRIAAGTAEAFISLIVTFGCLTVAWLLVTLGLKRM
jgi:hypothetical protein